MGSFGYCVPTMVKTIQICTNIKLSLPFIQSQETVCTVNVNSEFSEMLTFITKPENLNKPKLFSLCNYSSSCFLSQLSSIMIKLICQTMKLTFLLFRQFMIF